MKAMSDKEAAVFWKKEANYLEKMDAEKTKELFKAIQSLCHTLGIRDIPGNTVIDHVKAIDAIMKKRLAGR